MNLKKYNTPKNYKSIFDHNFNQINNIKNQEHFSELINQLFQISGLNKEIITTELKGYMIKSWEYTPQNILPTTKIKELFNNLKYLIFLKLVIIRRLTFKKQKKYDILLDTWFIDSLDNFYGPNLINHLESKKVIYTPFSHYKTITPQAIQQYLKNIPKIFQCFKILKKLNKKHNISLNRYLFTFLVNWILGMSLKNTVKLIISGNDNGFNSTKAKIMNAKTLLIQNGLRLHLSDSCFKSADHYFSIGGKALVEPRIALGCKFEHIHNLGSIRLLNFLNTRKITNKIDYDILFVDSWDLDPEKDTWRHFFLPIHEIQVIINLNKFANSHKYRIVYHLRSKNSYSYLKKHNLLNKNITYINREEESVYSVLTRSKSMITVSSTLSLEAMYLNKKIGLINYSENEYLNDPIKNIIFEQTKNNSEAFNKFIKNITTKKKDYDNWTTTHNNLSTLFSAINDLIYQ